MVLHENRGRLLSKVKSKYVTYAGLIYIAVYASGTSEQGYH